MSETTKLDADSGIVEENEEYQDSEQIERIDIKKVTVEEGVHQEDKDSDNVREEPQEDSSSSEEQDQEELQQEQHIEQDLDENSVQQEVEDRKGDKEQENSLKESEDTMQLPVTNMSQGAIEDEEMPSMVNISSISRIDESELNLKQDKDKKFLDTEENSPKSSPKKEEENDSDSVCVIDDDDDDEIRSDQRSSSYDDDEESSDYDSDEEYNRKRERSMRRIRAECEDGDEDEDEEIEEEEEEESIEDSEPDGFDGCSDDVVLRHSNGLTREQKERSASLQDLSLIKGSSPKNKHNVNAYNQKAKLEKTQFSTDRRPQGKPFAHVESKVKKYIMDMSEQRRMSCERRKKAQEEARHRNEEISEVRRNEDVATACRTMKDYTEKTLKEVAEYEESEDMYVVSGLGNGEMSVYPRRSVSNGDSISRQDEMDVDPYEMEEYRYDEKINKKVNGSKFNENQNHYVPERKGILRREDYSSKPVLNGEDTETPLSNLRTLSYDEYMKGSVNKAISEEVLNDESMNDKMLNISEKCNNNDTEPACVLRIENVVSNYCNAEKATDDFHNRKTPTMMIDQSTETVYQEDPEVSNLKMQLFQRNMQFNNLRDAYQKTMSENLAMKMELDNLKKLLAQHKEQKPTAELSSIAIQTEKRDPAPSMPIIEIDCNEQSVDPKATTTSMISAISSQWSDSTGSAAISMEPPPNITNAINSDESTNQPTKSAQKTKNAFSRAFMTSSKILQTLSNITHGKPKTDKYGNKILKRSARESISEPSTSSQTVGEKSESSDHGPPSSKKRKATDILEISSSSQPFKIPNTGKSDWERRKNFSDFPDSPEAQNSVEDDLHKNDRCTGETEDDNGRIQEIDEDVKVFVYSDNDVGKEHSFLIQAKEISDNRKPGVRECGPYLLGNVEVYMTEMNGTINIWGKELNQTVISQNAEELDISTKSKDLKPGFRWQSTPRIFNNQGSASTGKKSRVAPRFTQQQNKSHHHSCEKTSTLIECDNCHSNNHRLSWPSCSQNAHGNHNCCVPKVRVDDVHCGCVQKNDRRSNVPATCCKSKKFEDARRYSLPNVCQDNNTSCCCSNYHNHNHFQNHEQEESCRHRSFVRRHSFNPTDEEEDESDEDETLQRSTKSCNSSKDNSPHSCNNSKLVPPNLNNKKCSNVECSDPSCQNENDPLITQQRTPEVQEVRKRKLGGRKVRGLLMDLLKGCGDCRAANPLDKANLRQNTSVYEPSNNQKVGCSVNQSSCTSRANEKCSSCRNRNDKTAEIEAQLEFFRIEMEKLRSRSDVLHDMLDTLREADLIN